MKAGKVEAFDAGDGTGVIRLVDDAGAIPVRFAASVCRGVVPEPGVLVLAGLIDAAPGSGGPLSDTFAMRAGLVEPDRGVGDIEVVHTMGIAAARPGSRTGTLLVPFEESMFPELHTAFPEEVLGTLALGAPSPSTQTLPAQLRLLSGLLALSRRASRFQVAEGDAPVGGTFAAGTSADIGETAWPSGRGGPFLPVLQVGLEDARRIGVDQQINVFADVPRRRGRRVADLSALHVIVGRPGSRVTIEASIGDAAWLTFIDEVSVFPTRAGIEAAWVASGQPLPLDVNRFWQIEVALPPGSAEERSHSLQGYIAKHLPSAEELDSDLVLGGFAEAEPFKRLATFSTPQFPWLKKLREDWPRAALEVSLDEGLATLNGADCLDPRFEAAW